MKNKSGFFIIEALLSLVIFTVLLVSLLSMISFLQNRITRSNFDSDAAVLLQEGTEITRTAILADWNKNGPGTYYPKFDADAGAWILTKGEEDNLQARYSRAIVLSKVCRNSRTGEQISATPVCAGKLDNTSRVITTTVKWDDKGTERIITADLLVINTKAK